MYLPFLRHPRTTQELKANQDPKDPYVRAKRRNLPTAYDDQFIGRPKSWKKRRKTQYREVEKNYAHYVLTYHWSDPVGRMTARNIAHHMHRIGCFCQFTIEGFEWFGPEWKL